MRRPAMLVALLPTPAVTGCDDGPTQTVQLGCGVLGRSSTEFQLGSPVDLDTCEPDFSNRTVLVNGSEATIEIDAVWCDRAAGPPACD